MHPWFALNCLRQSTSLLWVLTAKGKFSANVCGVKTSFKTHHNEHNSVRDCRKRQKCCNILDSPKTFKWKSSFTTHQSFLSSNLKILKASLKTLPTNCKVKPTKRRAKQEKIMQQQNKERKTGKRKGHNTVSLLKQKLSWNFPFCPFLNIAFLLLGQTTTEWYDLQTVLW